MLYFADDTQKLASLLQLVRLCLSLPNFISASLAKPNLSRYLFSANFALQLETLDDTHFVFHQPAKPEVAPLKLKLLIMTIET